MSASLAANSVLESCSIVPVDKIRAHEMCELGGTSNMKWIKKGKIFDTRHRFDWMHHYAQNPNALVLEDRLRVYFTCRPRRQSDGSCVSYTTFVDLDRDNLSEVLYIHNRPVLELGRIGDFDQFGIMPGSVVSLEEKGEIWLYYVGWIRLQAVPYNWAVGLAVSRDGGHTFEKYGKGPILSSTFNEPYLQACPRVWRRAENEWLMWYQSGIEWIEHEGHMESVYVTMHAISKDGIIWERDGKQVIPSIVEHECQTSPSVFENGGKCHLIFSYRHGIDFRNRERGYRLGYAWSNDLVSWCRDDSKVGIDISETGWDSQMICYPHVVRVGSQICLFYCGNDFGRDGFGYAVLDQNNL